MNTEEIMGAIDAKRQEQRELSKRVRYAPPHVAETVEPRLAELHREIDALKVELYRANGGRE